MLLFYLFIRLIHLIHKFNDIMTRHGPGSKRDSCMVYKLFLFSRVEIVGIIQQNTDGSVWVSANTYGTRKDLEIVEHRSGTLAHDRSVMHARQLPDEDNAALVWANLFPTERNCKNIKVL